MTANNQQSRHSYWLAMSLQFLTCSSRNVTAGAGLSLKGARIEIAVSVNRLINAQGSKILYPLGCPFLLACLITLPTASIS